MWIWYREDENGELIILRMFGDLPTVTVPECFLGKRVAELSEYCFSKKQKYEGKEEFLKIVEIDLQICGDKKESGGTEYRGNGWQRKEDGFFARKFRQEFEDGKICELSGEFITEVFLPDGLKKIGDFCFYQCRNLERISFGKGITEIGSDAFMNCNRLDTFFLRARAEEPTALRQILLQRTGETEVFFENAAVHFPEFSEYYDLIGPAHIFELNIEGEGFRARQCFEKEKFQFEKYDQIFSTACDTESEKTLCKMAAFRLRYPLALKKRFKDVYQTYLTEHMEVFCEEIVNRRDPCLLRDLGEQGILRENHLETAVRVMMQKQWIEGTRMLLAWKKDWREKDGESEYGFEDF